MTKVALALGFLALHFYVYHFFASDEVLPARQSFESFPLELGDWSCRGLERQIGEEFAARRISRGNRL